MIMRKIRINTSSILPTTARINPSVTLLPAGVAAEQGKSWVISMLFGITGVTPLGVCVFFRHDPQDLLD